VAELSGLVDGVVRRERGRIVGALLRLSGSLDAAEDAFQEAVIAALQTWREEVPASPGAWLMTTAKNRARDTRRHDAVAAAKAPLLREDQVDPRETIDTVCDDHLRLILTCCHPELAFDNRIALTLKVVSGFSTEEIARAFMCSEATISQRILRAKKTLEESGARYAIDHADLDERITAALAVVYALFNEGHTARRGELMRLDLQAEALRLGLLLCDLAPREAEAFGLVAMMALDAARASSRVDDDGVPVLLADQDRTKWRRALLREGRMALQRARSLAGDGPYVIQAEIAAAHAFAPSWERTDWVAIVALYDALAIALAGSPIVALNRAIALSMRDGAEAGLTALEGLEGPLASHHLFYATRAQLLTQLQRDAKLDLEKALSLVTNDGERRLLERRLASTVRS
jgi:RNA polymerase sigma-70 factor (ECF subfamily)